MKKWIAVILLLLFVSCIITILLIPSRIPVTAATKIQGPSRAVVRNELERLDWTRWFPGKQISEGRVQGVGSAFERNGISYHVTDRKISGVNIDINDGSDTVHTLLNFIAVNPVNAEIVWQGVATSGINPVARIKARLLAGRIEKEMQAILDSLNHFYLSDDLVYDLNIRNEALQDTLLISVETIIDRYPTNAEIYQLVDSLHHFASSNGLTETGKPMLNIDAIPGVKGIRVKTGLPVNQRAPAAKGISYKMMPPSVRMLTAEVTGGQHSADRAMTRMNEFATDHGFNLPAIPFFSLQTDRRQQPDTTKWITKIFYPIM